MTRALFESFYVGNIDEIAKRVLEKNEGFQYCKNINGVYEEYLNQKTALKYLIKGKKDDNCNSELLDGHKVAACITCAISKVRLIVSSTVDDLELDEYTLEKSNRLNEQVAVLAGLTCLFEYMAEDQEFLELPDKDENEYYLRFPKTKYDDRSKYLDSLVRGLYYSNLISNINPVLIAHIYFMIEQFHRKSIELEILQSQN